jgi:ABC-type transport system involved in multi-copper enzyme maturation permease subunit
VINILQAELLKVRTRWMPYVLFLLMIGGAAVNIWLAGYVEWNQDPQAEFSASAFRTFAFPYSIATLLDSGQFWGSAIFVGILTSSSVSTEYNWGTVRQVLVRGQSRAEYLAVKIAGLAILCTIFLLAALAVGLFFSVWATSLADAPITLDVPGGPSPPEIGLMICRSALGILPYGLLAFMLSTVGRSTALGIGGTFGYIFAEGIGVAILRGIGGLSADLSDVALGRHVASLAAANRMGSVDYNSMAFREFADPASLPDPSVSALVILLYCLVFLAVTFTVFLRRDIRVHQ